MNPLITQKKREHLILEEKIALQIRKRASRTSKASRTSRLSRASRTSKTHRSITKKNMRMTII